jgi:hypothetical protein
MSRRYLLTTAGIVLGAVVGVLALYLSQLQAADLGSNKSPDKTVTLSERDFKKLVDRMSALESRVQTLEEKSGTNLLNGWPAGTRVYQGNDGFGPAKTIMIDLSNPGLNNSANPAK